MSQFARLKGEIKKLPDINVQASQLCRIPRYFRSPRRVIALVEYI